MTIRHYLAGGIIIIVLAAGGYWLGGDVLGLWEDCARRPQANCLLDEAEAALAEEKQPLTRAHVLVELALARADRGEVERAGALYKAAEEIAQGLDNARRQGMAWSIMGARAVQGGDLDHGRAFFAQANRAAWDTDEQTMRQVSEIQGTLSMQAVAGDLDGALESTAALRTGLWRAQTILAIAGGLAEAGQPEQVSTILPRALKALDAIEDAQVTAILLPMLAGMQAVAGDMEAARATAGGIEDIVRRSMAWQQIAEARARAGDVDGAVQSFANIEHFRERDWALWPIAVAQARAGDFAAAEESVGKINNYDAKGQARGDIAAVYAAAGQLDRAGEIAETLDERFERGRAWRMIVETLAKAGEYDRAIEFVGKIEPADQRGSLLHIVAVALAEAALIDEARENLGSIERPTPRDQVLSEIAAAEARAGATKQAIVTARSIETPQWRVTALHKVALAMGED